MATQATKFIDMLESQELLAPEIVEELRRQVRESKTRLTPELLAKLLVDNGHLTKFQATKLISGMKESEPAPPETSRSPVAPEEELTFAEETPDVQESTVAKIIASDKKTTRKREMKREPDPTDFVDDIDGIEVIDNGKIGELMPLGEEVAAVEPLNEWTALDEIPRAIPKPVRAQKSQGNPWDSFRILGVGLLLALVMIALYFLVNYFLRGSAEDRLNRADAAYEQRSYETAAAMYREFSETWPTHESASLAKVRSALATIRKDSEGAPDPNVGLQTAVEVLPTIADESALPEQRSDLAGALIALAGKFNERADAREAIGERKQLMEDLDRLMQLIDDPKFVGQSQRDQQAPTLLKIQEDRQRILREINRDEELDKALVTIDERLAAKDTAGAHQIRSELINLYPLLEANEQLQARVVQASKIQQSLVAAGTLSPTRSQPAPSAAATGGFLLGNRTGDGSPQLQGQVVFVKVKGAVFGLDGATGDLLWRNFVGRGFQNDPIRIDDANLADALICEPEKGHLSRVDGRSGEAKWFIDFGTPIHMPIVEGEDLYIATLDGEILSLDLEGGQVIWSQKLPQGLNVGPGLALGKPNLYAVAEHSNLYVLSRGDGTCREVMYLGHRPGSITVAPMLLLGQLFVFENINSDSSKIRILSLSDEGTGIRESQIPLRMDGNIVVSPQIDGRRMIVQSDLGELKVLDVEPTAEKNRVTELASRAKNVFSPQLSWLVAANNKLWVADSRFTRFDLQVSVGKLVGSWSKHDGDQFTGPPQKLGDVIVHTRVVRGNQGVRVSAVESESGRALWEIDLGVPITMIRKSESGLDAFASNATLFSLQADRRLRSRADVDAGQSKSAMNFSHPVHIGSDQTILFNSSRPNQFALYSPQDSTLRLVFANFGSAQPSCSPVAVRDAMAVGLDNGQFVLVDPSNGLPNSSPYQPAMQAGKKIRWNRPAYLEDSQTLILASDLQQLVRISVGDSLRALTELPLESPLRGPIVPMGSNVAAVQAMGNGDRLALFGATTLEVTQTKPLGGRLLAGPFAVAGGCVLQTDAKLHFFSSELKETWAIDFPDSQLVGAPVANGDSLIFVTHSGQIWVVDAVSGALLGSYDSGQGLSSTPIVLPQGILIGSEEGAVLTLPMPTAPMAATAEGR